MRRLYDLPYLLLPLAPLFWSGNFVLGRAVQGDVPPIGLAFWRWTGAFLILALPAWPHLKREWPVLLAHWRIVSVLALTGVAVFNTLVYIGLQDTVAINAVLMQSTMPVLIVLMSLLVFRERATLRQMAGIGISLAGVATIVGRGDLRVLLSLELNPGDLWVLTAVISYAVYSALLRLRPAVHPLTLLASLFLLGALMLAPFYAWETLVTDRPMPVTAESLASVGYVAVFPSVVAYFCFNRGVELAGANRAGLFIHLMPVFGTLLAVGLLGEVFHLFHAVGIMLILGGIGLATVPRS